VSSQACFLPIEKNQDTKFNIGLYNYQARPDDPPVLVIVSTNKGTSAQIVQEISQPLFFNDGGKRANFIAQRWNERSEEVEGGIAKQQKEDKVIVVIQVPLERKSKSSSSNFFTEALALYQAVVGNHQTRRQARRERRATRRGVRHGITQNTTVNSNAMSTTKNETPMVKVQSSVPTCDCCEADLVFLSVVSNSSPINLMCYNCSKKLSLGSNVWHCPYQDSHEDKICCDLCEDCGKMELKWNELNGLSEIKRDEKFPIRVTLQYYQSTVNGMVNEEIMSKIANMLESFQKQGDFVGYLIMEANKDQSNQWNVEKPNSKDDIGYTQVKKLLQETFNEEWSKYLIAFEREKFDDKTIQAVNNRDDLSDVLSAGGDRIKFFQAIQDWKLNKTSDNVGEGYN